MFVSGSTIVVRAEDFDEEPVTYIPQTELDEEVLVHNFALFEDD